MPCRLALVLGFHLHQRHTQADCVSWVFAFAQQDQRIFVCDVQNECAFVFLEEHTWLRVSVLHFFRVDVGNGECHRSVVEVVGLQEVAWKPFIVGFGAIHGRAPAVRVALGVGLFLLFG
jgi:hypothetical protein